MPITSIAIRTVAAFVSLVYAAGNSSLVAQDRADAAAMGKARASVASTRGIGAIFSNPGALDFNQIFENPLGQDLTFSIYSFGGTVGSTYFSSEEFREIFAPKPQGLTNEQRARLGDLLQDERLFANGGINLLTARLHTDRSGSFGLHYGHRVFARVNFPEDFTTILRTGNLLAKDFPLVNRGIGGDWASELGLTYSRSLGSIVEPGWLQNTGVGATIKLMRGLAHFELLDNSMITLDQVTVENQGAVLVQGGFTFRSAQPEDFDQANAVSQLQSALFPGTAGIGIGIDVGLSGVLYRMPPRAQGEEPRDAIYYGLMLQDAGSITWNTLNYERSLSGIRDTLRNPALSNEQFRRYQGTLERIPDFTTPLPAAFRAGLAMNLGAFLEDLERPIVVDVEAEFPLNSVPGNSDAPRIAIGGEWGATDWLSLRTGATFGGVSGFGIGLGAGVRPLDWLSIDIGTSEINALSNGKRVDLALRVAAGIRL